MNYRFSFKKNKSSVAYCAISFATGSINDGDSKGLAHLTEHLLFKGTKYRTARSINSHIEGIGGELNAYTTKEETVLHSTVLKEDIAKAINLLIEIAFHSIIPEKEVEKEKQIILDEINLYKDCPSEQIFDDFEENLFNGDQLSSPILGNAKTLKKMSRQTILDYYSKYFVLENMAITIVADLEENKLKKIIDRALDKYGVYEQSESLEVVSRKKKSDKTLLQILPFEKTINKRGHQLHCILGGEAYSLYDERRIPLLLLINILGGPCANSRLNVVLREKYALVYSIDISYNQYSHTGCFAIYFGCDKKNLERCCDLITREIEIYKKSLMSERALKAAKKQFLGQMIIASDNGEAQCISMGKSLLIYDKVIEIDEVKNLVESISCEDIMNVANDVFVNLSKIVYR